MTADIVLRAFAAFLTAAWQETSRALDQLEEASYLLDDWMQANWEILVEAVLLSRGTGFLEVYGDGADCHGTSSRVFRPEALPTHRIRCVAASGKQLWNLLTDGPLTDDEMTFWGFVRWEDGSYASTPLFNAVLLEGARNAVVGLDEIEFKLEKIS